MDADQSPNLEASLCVIQYHMIFVQKALKTSTSDEEEYPDILADVLVRACIACHEFDRLHLGEATAI